MEFNKYLPILEQMLRTLESIGKLIEKKPEVYVERTTCEDCPIINNCSPTDIFQEKNQVINKKSKPCGLHL